MRLINVKKLKSDMVLAKPIVINDRTLLNTGHKNLDKYKNKLLNFGINHVYIDDEYSKDIEINNVISDKTRNKSKKAIKSAMSKVSLNKKFNSEEIKDNIRCMTEEITNDNSILTNLTDIKTIDDYTFAHSINVSVISLMIGKALQYNQDELEKLGIGAILHDIGKVAISKSILTKPGKITDEEFNQIKKHPKLGYDKLGEYYDITARSRVAVLSHHERIDGSGYPNNREGNDIYEFARIVAVADVFDALTSHRCYRNRWPVHKATDFIIAQTNTHFDKKIVEAFLRNVAIYPNGTIVLLSNGEKGIVTSQNGSFPQRPNIKVFKNKVGKNCSKKINLMEKLNITIIETEE
ncbi:HD-GYP domain-containing protein [Selenihalanaerobacter shriftii]|uniref:HD domain-containing protein n=1 Tax=Selenihalanaerobacter shriftii TaxID=142842 RepID=A0A1T4JS99_9FIRM|nr:HD-GYP domain-containing protein [Selenihalanaerobacter shriftii]SJZ32927.1 HD domain-containing protein [Selenihalanaerobacter shriftii]